MAELGWPGLALPEEWGGQGLGIVDLAVLFEEMGYALAPSPLLSNTVAGLALALCGSDDQRERCLRPLAARRAARRPGALGRRHAGDVGELRDGGRGRRRRRRPRRREGARHGRRHRRLLPRRHRRRPPPPGRARRRRASRSSPNRRSTSPAASTRSASRASRSPAAGHAAGRGGRLLPGLPPRLRRARRRVDRDRPADDGDGGRVRQRPPAVRPADRLLPGGLPPLRADAAGDRELALGRLRRRLGRRRRARVAAARRLDGQGLRLRRRLAGRPTPRSRSTAASASPGSTTSTSSSSAASRTRRCSATPSGTASGSPTPSSPGPPSRSPPSAPVSGAGRHERARPHLGRRDRHHGRRPRGRGEARRGGRGRVRLGAGAVPLLGHPGRLPGRQHREDRRRHRDRLGLHPQPLHRRGLGARHRRDVGRPLPPRPRLRASNGSTKPGTTPSTANRRRTCARRSRRRG